MDRVYDSLVFKWSDDSTVTNGFVETVTIALVTTGISLVIAITGTLWWRHASPMGRRLFDLATYLRIMMPEVVFALAIYTLFGKIKFPLGTEAVVIGHVVWDSAFATLILQARASTLDPALEDAAADLGSSPWRVFRRVTLPGLAPGIIAAGLLAFTFSTDDIVTSYFLIGAGRAPLPIVILSLIRFEVSPIINAVGMMLMLLTVGLFATGFLTLSRFGRGGSRGLAVTLEH